MTTATPTSGDRTHPVPANHPNPTATPAPTTVLARPRPGEVHVWLVPVRPRPRWLALLGPAERDRAARLAATRAGDVFVTSRAVQRIAGSAYLGLPPEDVVVERSCAHCGDPAHGRPRFGHAGAVDYSVSHTETWLLLAVAGAGTVGADVEDLAAVTDAAGLARIALSPAEHLEFTAAADRTRYVVRAWTRKEAAVKLTGHGLATPPALVDVRGTHTEVGETVHLGDLGAPTGHVAALASTWPVTRVTPVDLPKRW